MNRRELLKRVGATGVAAAVASGMLPARGAIGMLGGSAQSIVTSSANPIGLVFPGGGNTSFYYEALPFFKNRLRESVITVHGSSTLANVGADGWLDGSNASVDIFPFQCQPGYTLPSWATGTWSCGFIGTGSETIAGINGGNISSVVPGTAGAYTTFNFTITAGSTAAGVNISGITAEVKNIFMYLPEYPATTIDNPESVGAFTNEAIAHYSQFACIQTEWFNNSANNSLLSTSSNRNSVANTQFMRQWGDPVTLASTPATGDTSGSFTTAWALPTGLYGLPMVSAGTTCSRVCTCTKGSTAFSWNPTYPLTENVTSVNLHVGPGMDGFPIEWTVWLAKACRKPLWFHSPLIEDGTYWSAGSYTSAVFDYLNLHWDFTIPVYVEASLEIWNFWQSMYQGLRIQSSSGYSTDQDYWAYRFHAMANLGRTKFGSNWRSSVRQVFAWQTGSSFFPLVLASMTSQFGAGTVAADLYMTASAPYCTPTIGSGDTMATIEDYILNGQGTTASDGPQQALRSKIENLSALAFSYGIKNGTYESGIQWNAVSSSNTNINAAIMDTGGGYQAAIEAYYGSSKGGVLNAGVTLACHNTGGVSTNTGAKSPIDELTNNYSALASSPTLLALQSFMGGFTPTRNVVSGSGAVTDCINFCDNNSSINPTYQYLGQAGGFSFLLHYGTTGYQPQLIYSPVAQTRSAVLTFTSTAAGATDVEVNGTVLYSNIGMTNFAGGTGTVVLGGVSLRAGWNYICLGRPGLVQTGVIPKSITWN